MATAKEKLKKLEAFIDARVKAAIEAGDATDDKDDDDDEPPEGKKKKKGFWADLFSDDEA